METAVLTPAQIGQNLELQLETIGVTSAGTLVNTFLTSIQTTPTVANIVAQAGILAVSAALQGPALEGAVLAAAASAGLQLMTWVQSQIPAPPPASAPPASPVS